MKGHESAVQAEGPNPTTIEATDTLAQEQSLDVAMELRLLRDELRAYRADHLKEVAEMQASLKACNERIDALWTRMDAFETVSLNKPLSGHLEVEEVVAQLRGELNEREQELLANDIEIANLPENNGENPIHIVQLIATKLGVCIDERDIVSAERMGGRHINAASPEGTTESRPRPIIVRLTRRSIRDDLLKNARVRRGADTADLNMNGPKKRFYLNERLTKFNRQLFRKARVAGEQHGWKYVWTQRGRILARIKNGESACPIRSEADLLRIFGPECGYARASDNDVIVDEGVSNNNFV